MDFSSQYQFGGGQQYQPFMAVPPLTPSNSHSAISDDYNRTTPPDGISNQETFTQFEYSHSFHDPSQHPRSTVPGPPTPPNAAAFAQQQHHRHQQQYQQHQSLPPAANVDPFNTSQVDGSTDDGNPARGSDDDEQLTPAQSRRKAQNRAAQRAFRERKEKHVKDLETKLAILEAAQEKVSTENERLKKEMEKMSTENEILRATSSASNGHSSLSPEPTVTGPQKYKPTDFYSNVLQGHQDKFPSHRIATSETGERLLGAGAAWDYILNHDLYKRGLVDVEDVSERLKNCARCDGQGPVFSESVIIAAMEMSVASGSDELI